MIVELIDHTTDPENKMGFAAAECYDAKTDRESNIKRSAHCKNKGHLAVLRFAYATFSVSGISRACSHQLVRIAHAGILQQSQRYTSQSKAEFIRPLAFYEMPNQLRNKWIEIEEDSINLYKELINAGMKKEDARYILLQSCSTSLKLCLNFQGWKDVLNNRTKPATQWEARNVALEIERQLHEIAPNIF